MTASSNLVEVNVVLKNNPGLTALKVSLDWSSNLILTNYVSGAAMSSFDFTPPSGMSSGCNFLWTNINGANSDGVMLTLTFAVASAGTHDVTLNVKEVVGMGTNSVTFDIVNGSVTKN